MECVERLDQTEGKRKGKGREKAVEAFSKVHVSKYLFFFLLSGFPQKMGKACDTRRVRILDIGNAPKSNHKKRAACKICRGQGIIVCMVRMVHMVR